MIIVQTNSSSILDIFILDIFYYCKEVIYNNKDETSTLRASASLDANASSLAVSGTSPV